LGSQGRRRIAGLRAVNVSDPLHPKEMGCYVPETPAGAPGIQSNDIGADDGGRLYLIDAGARACTFWNIRGERTSLRGALRRSNPEPRQFSGLLRSLSSGRPFPTGPVGSQ